MKRLTELVQEQAETPQILREVPSLVFRHFNNIMEMKHRLDTPRCEPTEALVIWGPPGTGKSRFAYEVFPGAYWKAKGKWWGGYRGQEVVIVDEFYGWIKYDELCRLLDRYPLQVERKGGHINYKPKLMVFTSNKPWEEWYNLATKPYQGDALRRRISFQYYFGPTELERRYIDETEIVEARTYAQNKAELLENIRGNINYRLE